MELPEGPLLVGIDSEATGTDSFVTITPHTQAEGTLYPLFQHLVTEQLMSRCSSSGVLVTQARTTFQYKGASRTSALKVTDKSI